MLGAGDALRPLERAITLRARDTETISDGYVDRAFKPDVTFRGVLVPPTRESLEVSPLGTGDGGLGRLHVRTTQDNLPEIALEDFIIDDEGNEWIVRELMPYTSYASVRLYGVERT